MRVRIFLPQRFKNKTFLQLYIRCVKSIVRERRMLWSQNRRNHIMLRLPYKGHAIKGLIICRTLTKCSNTSLGSDMNLNNTFWCIHSFWLPSVKCFCRISYWLAQGIGKKTGKCVIQHIIILIFFQFPFLEMAVLTSLKI